MTDPRFSMFSALRYPNYRLYWFGLICTVTARIIESTALPWLVFQLTGSPLMLGVTGLTQSIPGIALSFFGGVMADRADRRTVLFWTQGLMGLLAFVLATAIVAGVVEISEEVRLPGLDHSMCTEGPALVAEVVAEFLVRQP